MTKTLNIHLYLDGTKFIEVNKIKLFFNDLSVAKKLKNIALKKKIPVKIFYGVKYEQV